MLLAILLPGLSLIFNGRFLLGLFFCFFMFTGIGWIIGAYVAIGNLKERAAEKRHRETLAVLTAQGRAQ